MTTGPSCPNKNFPPHPTPLFVCRAAKVRFDEDEEFKTRAREAVKELQSGNPAFLKAWERICAASRIEFEAIYSRLGVHLTERGESFYNPMLKVQIHCF